MKERLLDLVFLVGVVLKGIDGVAELVGGTVLVLVGPSQLDHATTSLTADELREDPHDTLATMLVHGVHHLGARDTHFLAAYLLLHGVVKVAVVGALLLGTRRIYPWAIVALVAFLVFQVYELVVKPTAGVAVLTVFDVAIILLTWREWRHGRTLHDTARGTLRWLRREA